MKYLPWMSVMLVVSQSLLGCSDDKSDDAASAGSSSTAGKSASAGSAGKGSSVGGSSSQGGSTGEAGEGGTAAAEPKDIVDTALAAGTFTELAKALTAAGLVDALKGESPFTVFAPTDDAFAALEVENPGVLGNLGKAELTTV